MQEVRGSNPLSSTLLAGMFSDVGAWDHGAFDNDDAADWTYTFEGFDRDSGLHFLSSTFAATESSPIDADIGAAVVAAAAVVTWLLGNTDGTDSAYAATAAGWVAQNPGAPSAGLMGAARVALVRVISGESELAQLWQESGDDAWRAEIGRLDRLLANAE
jgi:Domain of unknown function (DUF4259)